MTVLSVLVAATAAWVFGAAYYMALSKPWMAASGVRFNGDGAATPNPLPYVLSAILLVFVAAMLRHVLIMSAISGPGAAAIAGLGLGLFVVSPWIAMNNLYAQRPWRLSLIDGGYATIGCGIIAAVLALF